MDWITLTVDPVQTASANIGFSTGNEIPPMSILLNAAHALERYADDPLKHELRDSSVLSVVLPDAPLPEGSWQWAAVAVAGDQTILYLREPRLAVFHAIAAAGVLRSYALMPVLQPMIAQTVAQVTSQVLPAVMPQVLEQLQQRQRDAALRDEILRGRAS